MLEQVLKRDRLIVLGGVIGLAALAWLDLWRRAGDMAMHAAMPSPMRWSLADLGAAAAMWGVMMVAMMLPAAAAMLLFSGLQRNRREQAQPATPAGLFTAGYLLVWVAWSLLGAGLQWALQALFLLSPHLAAFLLTAGVYQFTPWKYTCLVHCQSPLGFLLSH